MQNSPGKPLKVLRTSTAKSSWPGNTRTSKRFLQDRPESTLYRILQDLLQEPPKSMSQKLSFKDLLEGFASWLLTKLMPGSLITDLYIRSSHQDLWDNLTSSSKKDCLEDLTKIFVQEPPASRKSFHTSTPHRGHQDLQEGAPGATMRLSQDRLRRTF